MVTSNAGTRFIDLARQGRTDVRSFCSGVVRGALYTLLGGFIGGFIVGFASKVFDWQDPFSKDLVGIACVTLALLKAAKSTALKGDGRPFQTLLGGSRLDVRRVALGAGAWLFATLIAVILWLGLHRITSGSAEPVFEIQWPDTSLLPLIAFVLMIVPFQAASEELIFRGWLTQRLGQWIRYRLLLALLIGSLFALVHGFELGPLAFPYYAMLSMIFSAFCLREGRLETAIGAHAAHNIYVLCTLLMLRSESLKSDVLAEQSALNWTAFIVLGAQGMIAYFLIRLAEKGTARAQLTAP